MAMLVSRRDEEWRGRRLAAMQIAIGRIGRY
jgi:hypothetical protein